MPRILDYDIIGCYAQSELGHGSNVKGLETEARWHPAAQEFEIHSPYLTASKWWNGGMGRTATHAVCYIYHSSLFRPNPACATDAMCNLPNLAQGLLINRARRSSLRSSFCRKVVPPSPALPTPMVPQNRIPNTSLKARRRSSCRSGTRRRISRCRASPWVTSARSTATLAWTMDTCCSTMSECPGRLCCRGMPRSQTRRARLCGGATLPSYMEALPLYADR
jgi:hypothetical protein